MSRNYYYDTAPTNLRCGEAGPSDGECTSANIQPNCAYYRSYLRPCPAGYSHTDYTTCWGSLKSYKNCAKNKNSIHWNPLIENRASITDFEKRAFNCCDGLVITDEEKKKCGDLFYDGVTYKTKHPSCLAIKARYCTDIRHPERILQSRNKGICYEYCKKNPDRCNLKLICRKKVGKPEWNEICACYYPASKYQEIANKIAQGWNVPNNYIDPTPECIYPACQASTFNNKNRKSSCSPVNIANCYQNIDISLQDSQVGDIKLKQDTSCKTKFRKNGGSSTTDTAKTTGVGSYKNNNDNNTKNKSSSKTDTYEEETKRKMFFSFVFIVLIVYFVMNKGEKNPSTGGTIVSVQNVSER